MPEVAGGMIVRRWGAKILEWLLGRLMLATTSVLVGFLLSVIALSVSRTLRAMVASKPALPFRGGDILWLCKGIVLYVAVRGLLRLALPSDQHKSKGCEVKTPDKRPGLEHVIDVWKQVVEVQMHFNDMVMKIRNFALTLTTALAAGAALSYKNGLVVSVGEHKESLSALILLAGIGGWLAFFMLDRFYYHALLVGSVVQGNAIEEAEKDRIPHMQLASAITQHSRVRFRFASDYLRARDKLDLFYLSIASMLAVGALLVTCAHG